MTFSKGNAIILLSALLILISLLDQAIHGARYIKYLIPPACLAIWLFRFKPQLNLTQDLRPFYFYLAASLIYLTPAIAGLPAADPSEVYFIISYIAPFLLTKKYSIDLNKVFIAFSIVFFIISIIKSISPGQQFSFNTLNSNSSFEHSEFGFIFSFFIIHFYKDKNFKLLLLAVALCLISLKRIALVAAILGIFILHTKHIWYKRKYLIPTLAGVANVCAIWLIYFLTTDEFNTFIQQHVGISSNHFLMGRVVIYDYIFSNVDFNWLHGGGPGSMYIHVSSALDSLNKHLIHSDVLKLSAEFGYLFVFSFFALLYFSSKKHIEYIVAANAIMLTDNIVIYTSVMFTLLLIVTSSANHKTSSTTRA